MTNVQFNYMHECFERVFCELKWRKEVKRSTQKCWFKPDICVLNSYNVCVLQVEEEATDKDNKNCSKDGMCGKVRLCLPLSSLIHPQLRCLPPFMSLSRVSLSWSRSGFLLQNIFQLLRHRRDGGT